MAYSYEGVSTHPDRRISKASLVGVIYILTNRAFPGYVKIGYASDMDERLRQLNSSECVPFAFHVYATYGVTEPLLDRDLHALIDRLRPDLRSVEATDRGVRVREFYAMSPEDAYGLLYSIARLSGTLDRLSLADGPESEQATSKRGRRVFRFSEHGIPVGAEIELIGSNGVKATILGDGRILCEDLEGELCPGTLTSFARLHLNLEGKFSALRYWMYGGTPLSRL